MRSTRHTLRTSGSLLITILLFSSLVAVAQKKGDSSSSGVPSRRDAMLSREADLQNRELRLRMLNEGKTGSQGTQARTAEERKFIVNQIFEDFERLQLANRELMKLGDSFDKKTLKRMASLTEEMGKRARRLKTNLNIPDLVTEKEPEELPELDATQLKSSLQNLDASVNSFVKNPIFKDPRVTDVNQLARLRRDIFSVIDLSQTVRKAASKMGRH